MTRTLKQALGLHLFAINEVLERYMDLLGLHPYSSDIAHLIQQNEEFRKAIEKDQKLIS